ncbi:MAG: hypothetical protein KDA59_21235 [Planctomycetales bacterium]|nr:hypothetical protein [Planctomycetales bacterium]
MLKQINAERIAKGLKPYQESAIHGHHIVMQAAQGAAKIWNDKSITILEEFRIPRLFGLDGKEAIKRADTLDDLANISMAINYADDIHSEKYAKAVFERLQAVVDKAKLRKSSDAEVKELLIRELAAMRRILEQGNRFW